MVTLVPVDSDPFAGPQLRPVDGDPFAAPQAPQGKPGVVEDAARSIPGAIGSALTGLAGLPVDLVNLLGSWQAGGQFRKDKDGKLVPVEPYKPIETGSSGYMREKAKEALPESVGDVLLYEPKTDVGKAVQMGAEFAGGGGASTLVRKGAQAAIKPAAKMGAVGAGTEGVGQQADKIDPRAGAAARVVLGLAGGHLAGAPMGAANNANREALLASRGITEQQLADAIARAEFAAKMGVPHVAGEALGTAGAPLNRLAGDVLSRGNGAPIADVVNARQTLPNVDPMGGTVPRAIAGPGGILDRVSKDVVDPDAVNPARRSAASIERTNQTKPMYDAADWDPVAQNAVYPVWAAAVDKLAKEGLGGAYMRDIEAATKGAASTNLGPYSTLYQRWRDRMDLPQIAPKAIDAREAGAVGSLNSQLSTVLENESPAFRAAQQRYQQLSQPVEAADFRHKLRQTYDQALGSGQGEVNLRVGPQFANAARGREAVGSIMAPEFAKRVRAAGEARGLTGRDLDAYVDDINRRMEALALQENFPLNSATANRLQQSDRLGRNVVAGAADAMNLTRGSFLPMVGSWARGATRRRTDELIADLLADPNLPQRLQALRGQPADRQFPALIGAALAAGNRLPDLFPAVDVQRH